MRLNPFLIFHQKLRFAKKVTYNLLHSADEVYLKVKSAVEMARCFTFLLIIKTLFHRIYTDKMTEKYACNNNKTVNLDGE